MSNHVVDRKNIFTCGFWNIVNEIILKSYFRRFALDGSENIPKSGPYLLIANHVSRFDGLVLMKTIKGRPANYMSHKSELRGYQGFVLRSVGAFEANRNPETMAFMKEQLLKGQPIVMFPEGGIFVDGVVHPFKSGAARIMLMAAECGIDLPVIPVAITYSGSKGNRVAAVIVSEPIRLSARQTAKSEQKPHCINQLTQELHTHLSRQKELLQLTVNRTERTTKVG
ncbi:MAG: lysophospholipid acyltransferase family protein [Candidatus Obscuribacterales bacterium]|nr:lysophospholipid acyltransferase family protein [Candidatus Obscuribacterales bacterium]